MIIEHDFQQFFMANSAMMCIINRETLQFLEVNNIMLRQYGYSREEFLRMTILDIRPAEDTPAVLQYIRDDQTYDLSSWRHRRKDGSLLDVRIIALEINFGQVPARLVIVQDITPEVQQQQQSAAARQELEQQLIDRAAELEAANYALSESEKRYRSISELTSHWAYVSRVDEHGQIHRDWISESFYKTLGYSAEERQKIEADRMALVHPDDIRLIHAHIERLLTGEDDTVEFRMRDAHGEYRYVRYYAHTQWDANRQRVVQIAGVARDITAEKQAEIALRDVATREHEILEVQRQFIIQASHEFRTPLAIILSSATLLYQYYTRLTPERRTLHFERINDQVAHLVLLLDSLIYLVDQDALDPDRSKYLEHLLRVRL